MAHLFKMHHAPHAERMELYRLCLASDSWCQARRALWKLRDLESVKPDPDDLSALFTRIAFYTLYGRPFKQRGELKMDVDIVPEAHLGIHRGALVLRDKMYAHSDQNLYSSAGEVMNTVTVDIRPTGIAFGTITLKPQMGSISAYLELVEALIKTVIYRRDKTWKRWHRHLKLPAGSRWALNIGKDDDDVLKSTNKEPKLFSHSVKAPGE